MRKLFAKHWLLLIIILLVAALLRFYQLGQNPPSLTWDEVAFGYNAYAIGIDGRDEFGKFLPVTYLESFGDYKPPVYAYLDVLPIKFFGLTPFAVRFPSAFLGVLTVLMTFFLTKRIFYSSRHKDLYALSSAFILALSPWHIMLSRAAFEANVATFFLVCGVFTFIAGMQEKKWFLVLSAISFVLAMNTFNTSRIVAPLLVVVFGIIFFKKLFNQKKQTVTALIVGIILLLPLIPFSLSPEAKVRFDEVNIFSDLSLLTMSNQEIANDHNNVLSKVLHNRRIIYSLAYLQHYFDHFDPGFLFISGDNNPKFSIQEVGQLYLWEIPFFIAGILFLFRRREGYWWIIPLWLLIGLIPAATARETPHALRTEAALPTFQILVGYGLVTLGLLFNASLKKRRTHNAIWLFAVLLLVLNVFYFQYEYYQHYPRQYSGVWQYGYKEAIQFVTQHPSYKKVYDSGSLGRPYIYYLFYTATDPRDFRKTLKVKRDIFKFVHVEGFGKYVFSENIDKEEKSSGALYVVNPEDVPANVKVLKVVRGLNGHPALSIYTY